MGGRLVTMVLAAAAVAACGGGDDPIDPGPTGGVPVCGQVDINTRTLDVMRDWYFWYREVPSGVDPADYDSVDALLADITFQPIDRFTFFIPEAEGNRFFQLGQFIGVGVTHRWVGDRLYMAEVFPDSPADDRGFERGYEVLEINGTTVTSIVNLGLSLSGVFGPDEVGTQVIMRVREPGGAERTETMQKQLVTMDMVRALEVFDLGGEAVGYMNFKAFTNTAPAALEDAFDTLEAAGVRRLILDMRYNGGGFISVAQQIASQIGGATTQGQRVVRLTYNDRHRNSDFTFLFESYLNAIDATELVVIATSSTASASEMVINSLTPFIDVTVIGGRTFGKPVGSNSFDYCGFSLFPITFETQNAAGTADFYDGIPADCAAADDLTRALGDPDEAMLAEALHYAANGTCSVTAARAEMARNARLGAGTREATPYARDLLLGGAE